MVIPPVSTCAPGTRTSRPAAASPDQVSLGNPAPAPTLDAARKLFQIDPAVACHVQASFAIDDLRESQGTYFYPPTPVFTPGGKLIVGTNKGTLLAFDPASRKELWRRETGTVSAYNDPFCTQDGRLLFSNRHTPELLCLKEDGSEVFRAELPGPLVSDLQTDARGNAYAVTEQALVALGPDGRELWRKPVPEEGAAVLTTPDDAVLLLTGQGVTRLDAAGQEVWTHAAPLTRMPCFTPDNTMFLATEKGVEVVTPDGRATTAESLPGEPNFLEADARGNVLVVTRNAHLVSLDSRGKIRRQRDLLDALPSAPTVLADGTVLLCNARSSILKLDSDLEPVGGYYLSTNQPGERTVGLHTPQVAPNGAIYVTKDGTRIDALSPEGYPAYQLEGFHRTSPTFSADGALAVAHWDQVYLLKERTMQEVLATPAPEPETAGSVKRQGDFLVVGGSLVRVRKPRW